MATVPQSLDGPVTLEVESLDRLYAPYSSPPWPSLSSSLFWLTSMTDPALVAVGTPVRVVFTGNDAALPFPLRSAIDCADAQRDLLIYESFSLSNGRLNNLALSERSHLNRRPEELSRRYQSRGGRVKSKQHVSHQLQKIRRMLRAKVSQMRDRGLVAVVGEAVAKRWHIRRRRAAVCRETADEFDAKYGTDTSGIVQPWDLDIPDILVGSSNQYATAVMGTFADLLANLDIQHQLYSFIDLGSGKGRALLLASRFPFKEIIGVELSHQLQQTCRLNISRFRSDWQQCTNIVSLCQNATEFTFPAQNAVLYLFNPFGAEILRPVLANLEASMSAVPRRIYVIYVKPVHRMLFEQSGSWSLVRTDGTNVIYVNDMPVLDR